MADEQLAQIERFVNDELCPAYGTYTALIMRKILIEAIQRWETHKKSIESYQGGC